MAIVQTQAQLRVIAAKVGIYKERSDQIKALSASVTTLPQLRRVVNSIGFYNENADRLVAGGVTFI